MYIFIDESGLFNIQQQPNKVSCVAALVIPEEFAVTLFRRFKKLTKSWRNGSREIKGSSLDESQVSAVIKLLKFPRFGGHINERFSLGNVSPLWQRQESIRLNLKSRPFV